MGTEIERKFLVDARVLPPLLALSATNPYDFEQTYLSRIPSVRVRLARGLEDRKAYLTVKGKGSLVRAEFEYEIPFEDAVELMKLGSGLVTKTRWQVPYEGATWELDFFHGPLEGLILAECEMASDSEILAIPRWAVKDVTFDATFTNQALSGMPDPASFLCSVREMLT
jgi:adenylate cyclase